MIRVAMLSAWHVHAKGYANEINKMEGCRVSWVWDSDAARGEAWAAELGCEFVPCLDCLLSKKELDAVAVCTETAIHKEVMLKAIAAGKHIFTEKVLAFTTADALEIKKALQKTDIKFCISFPHRTDPRMLYAKKALEEGLFGEVTYARVRNAHDGTSAGWLPDHFYDKGSCGGGAMMDLGAHPMYLLAWLLGKPLSVSSVFTNVYHKPVEDNAVSVIAFENGAIGVSETAFVSSGFPIELEICGTRGSLQAGGPGKGVYRVGKDTEGKWIEVTELPQALPTALAQWVGAIRGGRRNQFRH